MKRSNPPVRLCVFALLVAAGAASAQNEELTPPIATQPTGEAVINTDQPEVAPHVMARREASYLTPDEGADLRVFHGVWRSEDLTDPTRRAAAAVLVGAYDDPALDQADAELRGEALLESGRLDEALRALEGAITVRAARLRAEALHQLGRLDDAVAATQPIVDRLSTQDATPAEIAEGVRALMLRLRLQGPTDAATDYRALAGLLAEARSQHRLDWRIRLVEAELLYSRDNRREAQDAAREALALNPRAADAWRLLGQLAVDSFAFDAAVDAAGRLDALSAALDPSANARPTSAGAEIRARARLRQRDGKGAREALAPALEAFPDSTRLRAIDAASVAVTFDRDAADDYLRELDERTPGSAIAWYEVGKALAEARQYGWSRDYLEEATRREPEWAEPWIQLGLMELQAGRDGAARTALVQARRLDPFHLRADNSLRLVEELMTWPTLETEHFIIRYRDGIDEVLAREMTRSLEAVHDRVSGDLDGGLEHTPERKTLVELMPDHAWFAVRITGVTDIWTMAAATGPVIALESPRPGKGKQVGAYDWRRVFQHEYTHTVNLDLTKNRLPHWFTEANAVYNEEGPWDERRAGLLTQVMQNDGLFDFERANIMFVRPEEPSDRSQAYAQSAWMYEYMLERFGNDGPLAIMAAHRDGATQDEAIRAGLGIETDEFMSDFSAWARERVADWGLSLPEGVPDIDALRVREAARLARPDAKAEGLDEGAFDLDLADAFAVPDLAELPDPESIELTPELVDRWLERYPSHPELLAWRCAHILDRTGGLPRAEHIEWFERYARARPVDPSPHRVLAKMYLDGVGRKLIPPIGPDGAIPHLRYLDAREIHSPAYAVELAKRFAAQRDWDAAVTSAERALSIDPFNPDIRELAATIALQAGDASSAEWHLEALTMIEPDRDIHQRRLEALRARR